MNHKFQTTCKFNPSCGILTITCPLGLWEVCGSMKNYRAIRQEAYHYWQQYAIGGEYDDL